MAIVNVLIEEDELTGMVFNDFSPLYSVLRNQLYGEITDSSSNLMAFLQMSSSFIHIYRNMLELVPNVKVIKEKFNDGILDSENYEVVVYTSEHEDYGKLLFAALCHKYREALASLLISASEAVQTDPTKTVYMVNSEPYGCMHKDIDNICVEMFSDVRQFVRDIILKDVSVLDYIINITPILADTSVSELIWKRYVKHNAKLHRAYAIDNLVVGKLMVTNDLWRFSRLLDATFEFVIEDKSIELDESSLLYYKWNNHFDDKIIFEHRLGPYAQALFYEDTQNRLSTPVIEGALDKTDFKFTYRSKFIPVNQITGEAQKDAKCEGLLAQFAS